MSFLTPLISIWRNDTILRRVVKNSGHLLSGSAISAALGLFQTFLTKQMLDIGLWGLVGVIVLFATNINRLLSFRMSEVVVQRLGAALPRISPGSSEVVLVPAGTEQGKTDQAAAAVKTAMLTEASTSIVAFIVLAALTPWAAVYFAKDIQTAPLFLLYGLILLSNIIAESSTGVLQALRRFNWIARINIVQSVITTVIMLFVFFSHGGIPEIILAYTVGKTINGIGLAIFALRELHQTLGAGWWKTPLNRVSDKRKMFAFMVNSNLNGTVYLFTRDSMALILAHILSTAEAGYFNLALTMVNFIMLPLDPLISPTYAEIIHTVALKQWHATRQLLRRVSLIGAAVVFSVGGVLALTGWFVIPLFFKTDAAPAYPALLILLIGYGFASIFQWNRPLLLALGQPGYPVLIALLTGLAELALIAWLVPQFGYLALAAILSAYFVVSIGIIVWRGLAEITRRQEYQKTQDKKTNL